MASSFTNIIVLTPNGRRQNVKSTPNTTILQILEEACKKHGFKAEEFDLRHHRTVLDVSTPLRFTGLPNNATLEMIPLCKARSESELVLGIHLENGNRVTGNFKPQDNLLHVINSLCPNDIKHDENPVIVYMRREIYGKDLQETSLKDLGLTSGRAMFRLIHRTPDELKTQANVSAPLPLKPMEEKPYVRKLQPVEEKPKETIRITKPGYQVQQENVQKPNITEERDNKADEIKDNFIMKENKMNSISKIIKQEKRKQTDKIPVKNSKKPAIKEDVEEFVFLGERNAMLFSYEMAQAIPSEDMLDDFFELTIDDAKKLLKDIKKQRLNFENGKLMTTAMRELEESKKQLRILNQYKKALIRIQFPNHTVLQGTFLPSETIGHVLEFVRGFLEDKELIFYLFTTPPKEILTSESNLIDINCVPGALLHFGTDNVKENSEYLRKDLQHKFTTLSKASLAATKVREENLRNITFDGDDDCADFLLEPGNDVNIGASTSAGMTYETYEKKEPVPKEKMPKWFRNQ